MNVSNSRVALSSVMRNPLHAVWSFPVTRFFAFVTLLLPLLILTAPIVISLLGSLGVRGSLTLLFFSEVYQLLVSFGLLCVFIRIVERADLVDFGFKTENAPGNFLLGIACGTALIVLVVSVMFAMRVYVPVKLNSGEDLLLSAGVLLFAAATEELIFRSYFFNILERQWGTIAAILVSSAGFGFAHMLNDAGGAAIGDKMLFCTFLSLEAGLSLAACYLLTRDLWLPIAAHWMWNFFEGPIFGTHVSGVDFGKTLIDARLSGPPFLTGGNFGPEGNVICLLIGTAAGAGLIYLSTKKRPLISYKEARSNLLAKTAPPSETRQNKENA